MTVNNGLCADKKKVIKMQHRYSGYVTHILSLTCSRFESLMDEFNIHFLRRGDDAKLNVSLCDVAR